METNEVIVGTSNKTVCVGPLPGKVAVARAEPEYPLTIVV